MKRCLSASPLAAAVLAVAAAVDAPAPDAAAATDGLPPERTVLPARSPVKKEPKREMPREKVPIPVDGPPAEPLAPPPGAVPELWFPVGETLEYTITWGHIPVGTALVWSEWIQEGGRWRVAIRMRTRTNKVLSTLYPVDDFVESVIDPVTFLPLRFVKKVNEGRSRYDQETQFDHAAGKARWVSRLDGREREFAIQPDTRCIVSLPWWLRRFEFKPGEERTFMVMADRKMYELIVKPERYEDLDVGDHDDVPCLKIEPSATFEGVFVRKGRMWMWVSRDPRRLCTLVAAEVPVGRVRAHLEKVRGPGDDFWVKSP